MFNLIQDYYKNCTGDGIIENIMKFGSVINKSIYILICIILGIAYLSYKIVLHFANFDLIFSKMNYLESFLESILISFTILLLTILLSFFPMWIYLSFYQSRCIKALKKNYPEIIGEEILSFHARSSFYDKLFYPFFMDNEYHILMKYIIEKNKIVFEIEHHIDEHHKELIDELIKLNNSQIHAISEDSMKRSNKLFYAFLGGILINKVIDFCYTVIDNSSFSEENLQNISVFILTIFVLVVGLYAISKNVYTWVYVKFWDSENTKQLHKTEQFNRYLTEKKIEI